MPLYKCRTIRLAIRATAVMQTASGIFCICFRWQTRSVAAAEQAVSREQRELAGGGVTSTSREVPEALTSAMRGAHGTLRGGHGERTSSIRGQTKMFALLFVCMPLLCWKACQTPPRSSKHPRHARLALTPAA